MKNLSTKKTMIKDHHESTKDTQIIFLNHTMDKQDHDLFKWLWLELPSRKIVMRIFHPHLLCEQHLHAWIKLHQEDYILSHQHFYDWGVSTCHPQSSWKPVIIYYYWRGTQMIQKTSTTQRLQEYRNHGSYWCHYHGVDGARTREKNHDNICCNDHLLERP